eukprot:TRINITY_DN4610_c0_g1_i1.p1 TRINITY_DN4610_c0_g1~~TRINITY_DN4610_c0_g1_i1.p1  ORF type:complete len:496 (+),score=54.06 TRINITY_DN4610_c0_g1_i1:130-1617(+)
MMLDTVPLLSDPISASHSTKTIGNFAAFVICINYVVGTGIFSLPYGFYNSGFGLATLCLITSGIFSLFCAYWVLEVLARTEGIHSTVYDIQDSTGLSEERKPHNHVTFRKFDFTKMFETYYGLKGKLFCQLIMSLYCYGVLWAFSAVFASSVDSLFFQFVLKNTHCDPYHNDISESCHKGYFVCIAFFACIVIPLACLDVAEQAVIQIGLASYRAIAFLLMTTTVAVALFHPNPNGTPEYEFSGPPYLAFDSPFKVSGFSAIFSSSVVALTFHYCIPDLIVTVKDKSAFKKVITGAIFAIIVLYFVFGPICALYFGKNTYPLVTLNWTNYSGLGGGWGAGERPWWAVMIQLLVMVFPILDMLSVFPLVAITLGNNILESSPQFFKDRFPGKKGKIICRFVAAVPPIALGAGLGQLNKIFGFTALFAFFLEFVFPAFLQIASTRKCKKWWGNGSEITPYSSHFSHLTYVIITLVFATFSFLFAFIAFVSPSLVAKI